MLCLTSLTIVPTSFWRPLFLPTPSLLPLGMAPKGWDEKETLEQGSVVSSCSSYNTEIFMRDILDALSTSLLP